MTKKSSLKIESPNWRDHKKALKKKKEIGDWTENA